MNMYTSLKNLNILTSALISAYSIPIFLRGQTRDYSTGIWLYNVRTNVSKEQVLY